MCIFSRACAGNSFFYEVIMDGNFYVFGRELKRTDNFNISIKYSNRETLESWNLLNGYAAAHKFSYLCNHESICRYM